MSEVRYASSPLTVRPPLGAAVLSWPDTTIDQAACIRAVATEHGEAVGAAALVVLPRADLPLTPQGKPNRVAIRSLGRARMASERAANRE